MKTITKHFDTISEAAAYQGRLYDKYDHVRLVSFPRFGESGNYRWEVKE